MSALLTATLCLTCVDAKALTESEQRARILFETRERETRLEQLGFVVRDDALDAYLQSVIDRLYPGHVLRVRLLKDLEPNAFAVATGNVYVHTGMLLRVRDEAELAAVLAHEGAHVLRDHMYRGVIDAKGLGGLAVVVPLLGPLMAYSSMAGYSRDLEREADRVGYEHLVAAGYDGRAAAPVFTRLAAEVVARGIKEPYFFADHPKLLERVKNFDELAAEAPPGDRGIERYTDETRARRTSALEDVHEKRDGSMLVAVLSEDGRAETYAPAGYFLLGEGYRLRARDGDEAQALAAYDRSITLYPDYGPAYGARGRLHARRGEKADAVSDLSMFIRLAPDARETPFAKQTLERLRQENPP